MYYVPFLSAIHERLAPRTYLEIGVALGKAASGLFGQPLFAWSGGNAEVRLRPR